MHHGFVEFDLRERGKVRHIKSIHISERVVQKYLCDQVLVPILSNGLIYDNGASIRGKGTHFALKRFTSHLSKYYRQGKTNEGYALLIDFSGYFDNIDHRILYYLLGKRIKDKKIQNLIKGFISVFGDGQSLGLGSQVSQICSVCYPDMIDHYIKEVMSVKYYGRYMDDMYLINSSKKYLKECLTGIKVLCTKLKIKINDKKTKIVKLSQGIRWLKGSYSLLKTGKILRRPCKDSTKRMRRKLKKFRKLLNEGKMTNRDVWTSYQSWRGNYRRRFNAYYQINNMDRLYNKLFLAYTA
jgi:hypothetical protein